jgi:hypothetical protein
MSHKKAQEESGKECASFEECSLEGCQEQGNLVTLKCCGMQGNLLQYYDVI